MPLIVTAMILAIQRLREMSRGGGVLARWTIGYYVVTTLIAIVHSIIMVALVWSKLMTKASAQSLESSDEKADELKESSKEQEIHTVVVQMFESLIPANVVDALATDSLLAVLITAIVVGYLLEPDSSIVKVIKEVEKLVTKIITFLIKMAPIGVFFLILPNLFKLDISDIGKNLGVLIGAALCGMGIHLFVVTPVIYFSIVRKNPYTYWFKNSPAWITGWGSASSAATLPVTLKCARERGIPDVIANFACPLGALINMDG